jgi:Protein of unknown function (DUF2924)
VNLADDIAGLQRLTVRELRVRYADVFGEPTRAGHKAWLIKRVAWRLQAVAEGDLSERARQRAQELANDADLRLSPPKAIRAPAVGSHPSPAPDASDQRLPPPGAILSRPYKGKLLQVTVLAKGFEFEGAVYRSLSAVAKAITGSHCNGFLFFRRAASEATP